MNSRPSTESLGLSETQDREDEERPDDFEEGEEEDDDNDDDDDDGDDGNDGDEGDDAVGSQYTGVSELERFARASASGLDKPSEDQLAADGLSGKKRERSNAKAVECLDMDGNLVELFRSGMSASMKLGIPQGDISLCCRGLKSSVMGYKFRFYGETAEKQALRLKKGFVLEGVGLDNNMKVEMTRTTRASRGEYGQGRGAAGGYDAPGRSLLDPPELKVNEFGLYFRKRQRSITTRPMHYLFKNSRASGTKRKYAQGRFSSRSGSPALPTPPPRYTAASRRMPPRPS